MQHNHSRTLVQLQAELIDTKVELAVSKAISQVVDQIVNLRHEVHREMGSLRQEMHHEISDLKEEMRHEIGGLKSDMSAVKTRLGMTVESKDEIRRRLIEYGFKTSWIIGVAIASYMLARFHFFQ
jgi:phosphoglycerate-specific signal transduction histidine kinase